MIEMLEVVRLQADGKRHERVLLDTPNTSEHADERAAAEDGVASSTSSAQRSCSATRR